MATVLLQRKWLLEILTLGLVLAGVLIWWFFHSDAITWETKHFVRVVDFSPDRQVLASAENQERGDDAKPLIVLRHVPDGQIIRKLVGQQSSIFSLAFSPDGTLLAAAGTDSNISLWQVADGHVFRTITISPPLPEIKWQLLAENLTLKGQRR